MVSIPSFHVTCLPVTDDPRWTREVRVLFSVDEWRCEEEALATERDLVRRLKASPLSNAVLSQDGRHVAAQMHTWLSDTVVQGQLLRSPWGKWGIVDRVVSPQDTHGTRIANLEREVARLRSILEGK